MRAGLREESGPWVLGLSGGEVGLILGAGGWVRLVSLTLCYGGEWQARFEDLADRICVGFEVAISWFGDFRESTEQRRPTRLRRLGMGFDRAHGCRGFAIAVVSWDPSNGWNSSFCVC